MHNPIIGTKNYDDDAPGERETGAEAKEVVVSAKELEIMLKWHKRCTMHKQCMICPDREGCNKLLHVLARRRQEIPIVIYDYDLEKEIKRADKAITAK
jgi:hypothetical protein